MYKYIKHSKENTAFETRGCSIFAMKRLRSKKRLNGSDYKRLNGSDFKRLNGSDFTTRVSDVCLDPVP